MIGSRSGRCSAILSGGYSRRSPSSIGITLITFVIINAAGSPLQDLEFNPRVRPEDIERIRSNLGLDEPVWKRYFIWVGNVLQGDLGLSLINFRPGDRSDFRGDG